MQLSFQWTALLAIVVSFTLIAGCQGHGYMSLPRSRQLYANQEGKWWPTGNWPDPESEPQSANRRAPGTVCGSIAGRPYDDFKMSDGTPVAIYDEANKFRSGQTIDVGAVFTAYHKGHMEFKICNRASAIDQECFDAMPLKFVSPQDDRYPERLYLDPYLANVMDECPAGTECYANHNSEVRASGLKIPDDFQCDHCVLQWIYVTANSCLPEGYRSAPESLKQFFNTQIGDCPEYDYEGNTAPERFWNCADIAVCKGDEDCAVEVPSPSPDVDDGEVPSPPDDGEDSETSDTTPVNGGDDDGAAGVGRCGADGKWPGSLCYGTSTGACRAASGACYEYDPEYDNGNCFAGTQHCKDASRRRGLRRLLDN